MGDFLSKSRPVTQTNTQNTTLPSWLTNAGQGAVSYANKLPDVTPYTGSGVAGLTPAQLQAIALAQGLPGNLNDYTNSAFTGATNAMNFATPMVSAASVGDLTRGLLSPYTGDVASAINADIDRQKAQALAANGADAARAGAYAGGVPFDDRAGLLQNDTTRNFEDIRAKTLANLYSGAYDTATRNAIGIAQGNQNAGFAGAGINLQGTGLLNSIINAARTGNWGDVQGLLGAGGVEQQTNQAGKTFDYNEFVRQLSQPFQKLQAINQTVGTVPHDTSTTGTQQSQIYSSPLGQIAGLALGAAGLGLNPLSGLSSLGGMLGGLLNPTTTPQIGGPPISGAFG